jgi:hypothetical protein
MSLRVVLFRLVIEKSLIFVMNFPYSKGSEAVEIIGRFECFLVRI